MSAKFKVDQKSLNQYYSAVISIKYKTQDVEEIKELVKKHWIKCKVLWSMGKEYFTVVTKKNQIIWQIDANRFVIPIEEKKAPKKETKTKRKTKS